MKLENHIAFLERVSPNAAWNLRVEYLESIKILKERADCYPKYSSSKRGMKNMPFRYILFYKYRYRIVYLIKENNVIIFDIIDCRQGSGKNKV
jgi:hypothetical protein